MPTNGFAEIIKAVGHEPLGLLSLVVLILGALCYQLIGKLRKPKPNDVVLIIAIILMGFVGVVLAFIRANNLLTAEKKESEKPPTYTVLLKIRGQRSSLKPTQIPFKSSAGQINFGCGETKSESVSWVAPTGADQLTATAVWANADKVKSYTQQVDYPAATSAKATGTISGYDRNWVGDCPGGGHAELVIQGTYQIQQPTPGEPFEDLKSGYISIAKPYVVALPVEKDLKISALDATVITNTGSPIVISVTLTDQGTAKKQIEKAELSVAEGKVTISLQN